MAAWRRAIELSLGDADVERLRSIAQSRTEPASRVERAPIVLAYREDPSFFAVGRALGLHHQTVQRCGQAWASSSRMISSRSCGCFDASRARSRAARGAATVVQARGASN